MNYKVGQVVYLLNEKNLKVIPCLIIEELVKSSLAGKEVSYTVRLPGLKQKEVGLAETGMKTFSKLSDAKHHMIENAKEAISAMIESAARFEAEFFDNIESSENEEESISEDNENDIIFDDVQSDNKNDKVKVDIGNGIMASISLDSLEKLGGK